MRYQVCRGLVLTDEHAASSYGLPVLVDQAHLQTLGPADLLGGFHGQGLCFAGDLVRRWMAMPERTIEERAMGEAFLHPMDALFPGDG